MQETIITIFEFAAVSALITGFIYEKKVVEFENRLFAKIRKALSK